jgi:16S rRNA (uracil1498-N3)-methyltransferase
VVERRHQPALATFFVEGALEAGASVSLGEAGAHHVRVRRIGAGETVTLTNGEGTLARGEITRVGKTSVLVSIHESGGVPAPPPLRLFVPVADRDRMLWLAEKCAELSVSEWQPVRFRRSLSVSPRGEGEAFAKKVRARMISALEQSGGAWLPVIHAELTLADALLASSDGQRNHYVLEREGQPLVGQHGIPAADAMLGPEGGFEREEVQQILDDGSWVPVSLGENTLRFETAGVLAAGILRAQLGAQR